MIFRSEPLRIFVAANPVSSAARELVHGLRARGHVVDQHNAEPEIAMRSLRDADACIAILPCDYTASAETGFAIGNGKQTCAVAIGEHDEQFLTRAATLVAPSVSEALRWIDVIASH